MEIIKKLEVVVLYVFVLCRLYCLKIRIWFENLNEIGWKIGEMLISFEKDGRIIIRKVIIMSIRFFFGNKRFK